MITIVFFVGAVLDFFSYGPHSLLGWIVNLLMTVIVTGVGWLVGNGVGLLIAMAVPQHWAEVSKVDLVNLRDADGVEGNFFLGSGHIESTPYYFCYYEISDGGFVPWRVKADGDVTIYEEDRQDASLVRYQEVFKNQAWEWIAVDFHSDRYTFHIPKGTIKRGYSLR